jgi:hypothetical protein
MLLPVIGHVAQLKSKTGEKEGKKTPNASQHGERPNLDARFHRGRLG